MWLSGRPREVDRDLAGRSQDIWALLEGSVVLVAAAAVVVVAPGPVAVSPIAVAAVLRRSAGTANNLDNGAK